MYLCTSCGNKTVFREYTTMSRLLVYDKDSMIKTHVGNNKIESGLIKCVVCNEDSRDKVLVNNDVDKDLLN